MSASGDSVDSLDLNAWRPALEQGQRTERGLAYWLHEWLGFNVQPANKENPRAVDMVAVVHIDSKDLQSPYPSEKTPSGLEAYEHVTLDVANVLEYDPDVCLWCMVDYTPKYKTKGVFVIKAGAVQRIMKQHPERIYSRSSRTHKDKVRKVGVSIREMSQFSGPGMDRSQTVDTIHGY